MGSNRTTGREPNQMRLLETNVVDVNVRRPLTKPNYGDDLRDHGSNLKSNISLTRCEDPLLNPQKFSTKTDTLLTKASNQNKGKCARGTHAGESVLQNTRYIVINNRVYKDPRSTSHLDMLSPSTDIGSTKALAGLIVMCNDRMRRSFLKYGVFGVPVAKKPILDRVGESTKLFLFEFEARALWGIYEATSEASLDIEKDIYRGSEISFAAQVKVCTYKQCRPLPEKLFQLAIEDNYFTPKKFNFELTEKQVSNLTRLYCMREMEKSRIDGRTISAAETSFPHVTPGSDSLSEAQDGTVYQADGVTINDRATLETQKNMPYAEMLQTTSGLNRLSQSREGLVRSRGNTEENFCIRGIHLTSAEYDTLKNFSLYRKDCDVSKIHEDHSKQEFTDSIVRDLNGGHAIRSSLHVDAKSILLEPTSTTLYCYPHGKESFPLEDDLSYQFSQSKPSHYKRDPTYESSGQGLNACSCSPFVNPPDAVLASNRSFKLSSNEDHYQCRLKPRQPSNILFRQRPLRSPDEQLRNEASVYQKLGEDTDEALWDLQWASKEILKPCSKEHVPKQGLSTHPAQVNSANSGFHDILHVSGNGYATQRRCPTNQRYLTMPGELWTEKHDHHVDGFASMDKECTCSRTVVLPDDEALRGNLYHERLSSRSKILPDDAQAQVQNFTCFAKCATARSNTTNTDDAALLSTPSAVDSFIQNSHELEDDEAWLENARRLVERSFTSNNCGGAEDSFENDEQDTSAQVENQVSNSLLRILRKQPRLTVNANRQEGDDAKPRQSVWSRLSTSRKTFNSREDIVLLDEHLGKFQFSTESLPWKRRTTCQTHLTEYEVGKKVSIEEECPLYERKEVTVDFKRRKAALMKVGNPSDANVQMDRVMIEKESEPRRDPCENQRERRKIRRPL